MTCEQPGGTDAEHGSRHQNSQIRAAPLVPVGPHGDRILGKEYREQDRCALQRRHDEREQRSGDHADAGKATLPKAEQCHGGDRQKIK